MAGKNGIVLKFKSFLIYDNNERSVCAWIFEWNTSFSFIQPKGFVLVFFLPRHIWLKNSIYFGSNGFFAITGVKEHLVTVNHSSEQLQWMVFFQKCQSCGWINLISYFMIVENLCCSTATQISKNAESFNNVFLLAMCRLTSVVLCVWKKQLHFRLAARIMWSMGRPMNLKTRSLKVKFA